MLRNTSALFICTMLTACFPNPVDPVNGTTTGGSANTSNSSTDDSASSSTAVTMSSSITVPTSSTGFDTSTSTTSGATTTTGFETTDSGSSSTGAPLECQASPGVDFGACIAGACEDDQLCLQVPAGTMCLAECSECSGACVDELGGGTEQCMTKGCVFTCQSDDDCVGGLRCDARTSICVWPETNICTLMPGGTWGPCVNGGCPNSAYTALCVEGAEGSICAPDCSLGCPKLGCDVDGQCDANLLCTPSCQTNLDCPSVGMICDDELAACVWPN